jgi:hypothetical protein
LELNKALAFSLCERQQSDWQKVTKTENSDNLCKYKIEKIIYPKLTENKNGANKILPKPNLNFKSNSQEEVCTQLHVN